MGKVVDSVAGYIRFRYSGDSISDLSGTPEVKVGVESKGEGFGCTPYAMWSVNQKSFEACVDLHGLAQLYYFYDSDFFYASLSLEDIVKILPNPQLDYSALSVFYRMGSFVENDTPIEGVKLLGPNGRIVIENQSVEVRESYAWAVEPSNLSCEQAVSNYARLFSKAISGVADLPISDISLPLSGGRDSRHILLELIYQERPIKHLVTSFFEPDNKFAGDVTLASELARRAGLDLEVVHCKSDWVEREKEKNSKTSFSSMLHSWYVDMAKAIPSQSVLVDGLCGDVLSSPHGARYNQRMDEAFLANNWAWLISYYLERDVDGVNLFRHEIREKMSHSVAAERLLPVLKKYASFCKPALAMEFYCRSRRNTALPAQYVSKSSNVYFPFLSLELFEFLSSLSLSTFPEDDIHTPTIRATYPEYADIPYEGGGSKSPYSSWESFCYRQKKCSDLLALIHSEALGKFFDKNKLIYLITKSKFLPFFSDAEDWVGPYLVHFSGLVALLEKR